jgi:hypothetical protein
MLMTPEVRRLRRLVRRYRSLVCRMKEDALAYTDGIDCPFCSGLLGYESAHDREDEEVKHARLCPTRQAEKLAAVEI